jgi:type IX secretion system PorP/SprF family membrane protein
MKRNLLVLILTFIIGFIVSANAQVDPLYAQYLNNPLLINPAYTGLNNNFNASLIYRKQWAGFDGSPSTANVSAHTSLFDNKMGVGGYIMQDKAAINKNTEIQGTYAYRIEYKEQIVSFGLQAGLINYRSNDSALNPKDPTAPEFQSNQSFTKPTFGAGVTVNTERYFVGLSVPRMLKPKGEVGNIETSLYQQHFYLTGAYVVFLTDRIRLKPAILFKGVKGAPISTDLNFSANIDERYVAGVFTRNFNTYGVMGQMKLQDKYRFGYAFEIPTNKSVGVNFTSHEIMIGINMSLLSFHTNSVTNF